jgi:type IV secretion system protein VirB9
MIRSAFLFLALIGSTAAAPANSAILPDLSKPVAGARTAARAVPAKSALVRVEAANRAAVSEPSNSGYLNAMQVYAWAEGGLYRLYAAPGIVSDIALQPGEGLISVASGDTVRWVIGDTTSGSGASKRTHILVKPASAGLATNLVITTDRRVYLVQLESHSGPAMAVISWTYPQDELLALKRMQAAAEAAMPVAGDVAVESLNFNYAIKGDRPTWRPIRAFDDGHQVFIEFPPTISSGEAPPLFVIGSSGQAELVNYRLRGRYYVVDRLFSLAELRLGEKRQQVVRIVRSDGFRRRQGRAS